MPSSPSPLLNVELQAAGENLNTWGAPKLNQALQDLTEAIAGRVAFTLSGTKTLTSTNYVTNEARQAILHVTGGTGGNIVIPAQTKLYLVVNQSSGNVTIAPPGGTSPTIVSGQTAWIWSDATNCYDVNDTDFNGQRLTNVGYPILDTDAATRKYVLDQVFASMAGFPGLVSNANKPLRVKADETTVEWAWPDGGRKTAGFTAVSGNVYACDTTSGAFSMALPASPVDMDWVGVRDIGYRMGQLGFGGNALTVTRNGKTICGVSDDCQITTAGEALVFRWDAALNTWTYNRGL